MELNLSLKRSLKYLALPCLAILAAGAGSASAADAGMFGDIRAPAGAHLSAVADATPMRIVLSLPLRDQKAAEHYAAAVSDPSNALYGHYLTPAQYGARFGADRGAYESLRSWATANGLTPGERTDSRATLSVGGTAGQFARLFATRFASFQTAHNGDGQLTTVVPRLPAALIGRVDGVIGLSSGARYAPLARINTRHGPHTHSAGGSGVDGAYSPADLRHVYDVPAQKPKAAIETVAIFEQGGYTASDVAKFETQYGLPAVPITLRSVNGSGTAPNSVNIESVLDIDAVLGINPAIAGIVVYVDSFLHDPFSVALVDSFGLIAQDNSAKTVSISYGTDEAIQGTPAVKAEGRALIQLAAQGQTVFVSSGDDGAYGRTGSGLNAPDPGSQPLVTSVGGTTLYTVNSTNDYLSEQVWNQLAVGLGATGGGVSAVWAMPAYQKGPGGSIALANGGSATMRNVPDIAADADPASGYSVYSGRDGGWVQIGGTSLSAPLWAGFATIFNAARVGAGQPRLGFFNPMLYSLGRASTFGLRDVLNGSNGNKNIYGIAGFEAGYGYDNDTGFGSTDVADLLLVIVPTTNAFH